MGVVDQAELDDFVGVRAGGYFIDANCPAVLQGDALKVAKACLDVMAGAIQRYAITTEGRELRTHVVLTASTSFGCVVKVLASGAIAILVPAGVPARMSVLARLLLAYWDKESVQHVLSPDDKIFLRRERLPPLLIPLLLEEATEDWWERLDQLDRSIQLEGFDDDVLELLHLSLLIVLSHEGIHVLNKHFAANESSLSGEALRRARELDADTAGAALAVGIMSGSVEAAIAEGRPRRTEAGFLRLGYAAVMVFSLMDSTRKWFGHYDGDSYNHPMVRVELFLASVGSALSDEGVRGVWSAQSAEGWRRAVLALGALDQDARQGRFGFGPAGPPDLPLHTMLYGMIPGGPIDSSLRRKVKEARELLSLLRDPSSAQSKSTPDTAERIGLYSLDGDMVRACQAAFGRENVVVAVLDFTQPPELEIETELGRQLFDSLVSAIVRDRHSSVAQRNEAKEHFFSAIDHLVMPLASLRHYSTFMHAMNCIENSRLSTLYCVCTEEHERTATTQIDAIAKNIGSRTTAELVGDGTLAFARRLDLHAIAAQTHLNLESAFRAGR